MRLLPAQVLRDWCQALGLATSGIRATLVQRITANAEQQEQPQQPNPENDEEDTKAVVNPREISIVELTNVQDRTQVNQWLADIELKANIRSIGTKWKTLQSGTEEEKEELVLTERDDQTLMLLKSAIQESMSKTLKATLLPLLQSGEISGDAQGIVAWVKKQSDVLGDAQETKAFSEFSKCTWSSSKKDLLSWVGQLRSISTQLGPNIPPGRPREHQIRLAVFNNVSNKSPQCAQIVNEFKQHNVSEAGYGVDELVEKLSRVMYEAETSHEKQCTTFCVHSVEPNVADGSYLNAGGDSKKKRKKKGNNNDNNNENNDDDDDPAFYGGANPGGRYNNNRSNGNWNNNASKYCEHCDKHYKALRQNVTKYAAIHSHNTKDCKFLHKKPNIYNSFNRSKGQGKNNNNNRNNVQKNNDKKGKKGGKGGKKGKGKGKKGGGRRL